MLVAVVLAQWPPLRLDDGTRVPLAGYVAAALWLLGLGFVSGWLLRALGKLAGVFGAMSPVWRIALSQLRRPSARHRLAAAAVTSAVGMTAGMVVMVGSFDHTMRGWIERSMRADIYVASAADQSGGAHHLISADTVKQMAADVGVSECFTLSARRIRYKAGQCWLLGEDAEAVDRYDLHGWVTRPAPRWWEQPKQVLINESFSQRHNLAVGDKLQVPLVDGAQERQVAGIFTDYGNEHGSIILPQSEFRDLLKEEDVWRVALGVKPGASADAVRDRLQVAHPGLSIFTQGHLRSEALRIFQQTFSVTYALQVIGVVVAMVGLGLALASLLLERQTTLETLRCLGLKRVQALLAAAIEGGALAVAGGATGILGGLWLGWLLVYRVNKQCFGWTLEYAAPGGQMLALGVAVLLCGAGVAGLVAWARFKRGSSR
jgi:putative ABC transport system permease protein